MTAVELYQREAPIAAREWGDERLAIVVDRLMVTKEGMAPPTPAEVDLFAMRCRATGLDPFSGQIHAIYRRDKNAPLGRSLTFQTGIDGLWLIASRTGLLDGMGDPEWLGPDGWVDAWPYETPPLAARVTVRRKGAAYPFVGVAMYREYVQTYDDRPQGLWARMPANQLRKCAAAQALREAFANDLGDVYETAELDHADAHVPADVKAERQAEAAERAGEQRIGPADVEALTALARAARLTRGEARGILEDTAGVGRPEHVRRRDLPAVIAALQARIPKDSAPTGAPNVGTPEVHPADEPAADGDERVEPAATGPVADTTGEPDAEAGTAAESGPPPDPAQPRRRRERKPKPAEPVGADPPKPDDTAPMTPGEAEDAALADAFQPPAPLEPLDAEPPGFGTDPHPTAYGPGAP